MIGFIHSNEHSSFQISKAHHIHSIKQLTIVRRKTNEIFKLEKQEGSTNYNFLSQRHHMIFYVTECICWKMEYRYAPGGKTFIWNPIFLSPLSSSSLSWDQWDFPVILLFCFVTCLLLSGAQPAYSFHLQNQDSQSQVFLLVILVHTPISRLHLQPWFFHEKTTDSISD